MQSGKKLEKTGHKKALLKKIFSEFIIFLSDEKNEYGIFSLTRSF